MTSAAIAKAIARHEYVSEYQLEHEFGKENIQETIESLISSGSIIKTSVRNIRVYRIATKEEAERIKSELSIDALKSEISALKDQISAFKQAHPDLDPESVYKAHIERLHVYNQVKDVGQMLFGKCAQIEGLTTKDMYDKFEMDIND